MCGAATVMGTFVAAVGMQLPINLVVVVPAVENMPDGNSYRPSDVITSDVRQDHRSRQHRRRRPPDPVRRADLRAALRAAGAGRRRHADRRLRGRARQVRHRPDEQARRPRRPNCSPPARRRSTAPGACRCGTNTSRCSNPASPTSTTSAAAGPARSPPAASSRASPKASAGRTWTSPASPTTKASAAWPPAARSACCRSG